MTTAEWLRRAADLWSDADATQDQEGRRIKIILAEGFERLAKHAAFLAEGEAYPSVDNVYPSFTLRSPASAHAFGDAAGTKETEWGAGIPKEADDNGWFGAG